MKIIKILIAFSLFASLFSAEINRGEARKVALNVYNEFKPENNSKKAS